MWKICSHMCSFWYVIFFAFFTANLDFLFQVATANLAWASVAIHQVQVIKVNRSNLKISHSNRHTRWSLPVPVIMISGDFVCSDSTLVFFYWGNPLCTGTGLSLVQSNHLSRRFSKQLLVDVIMSPVLHLYEHLRDAVSHCSTGHSGPLRRSEEYNTAARCKCSLQCDNNISMFALHTGGKCLIHLCVWSWLIVFLFACLFSGMQRPRQTDRA